MMYYFSTGGLPRRILFELLESGDWGKALLSIVTLVDLIRLDEVIELDVLEELVKLDDSIGSKGLKGLFDLLCAR